MATDPRHRRPGPREAHAIKINDNQFVIELADGTRVFVNMYGESVDVGRMRTDEDCPSFRRVTWAQDRIAPEVHVALDGALDTIGNMLAVR